MKLGSGSSRVLLGTVLACSALAVPAVALAHSAHPSQARQLSAIGRCKTTDLTITLGASTGTGGDGATLYPLEFSYHGARPCLENGTPRLVGVTSDGTQVGYRSRSIDQVGKAIFTMHTGDMAHSVVGVFDVSSIAHCAKVPGALVEVFAPSERTGQILPGFAFTACSNKATMEVTPIAPGA